MKTMNKTLVWLVAAVLTLTLTSGAHAQDGKQRTGKVVRIKGEAQYSTGNKVWQPLKVGVILRSGNSVRTAKEASFVDIVLNQEETAAAAVVVKPVSTSGGGGGGGGGGDLLPA